MFPPMIVGTSLYRDFPFEIAWNHSSALSLLIFNVVKALGLECRLLQQHAPSIREMPEITSKHIGIGGDPAKHVTWRLQGSISAECYDAAVNLTAVGNGSWLTPHNHPQ
jgi:hypothetical protein